MSDECPNCGGSGREKSGIVKVQVGPGERLRVKQIGKSVHYAGVIESIFALAMIEQVNPNNLKFPP